MRKRSPQHFKILITLLATVYHVSGNLYCQPNNCYELLSVQQDSSIQEIQKSFRSMARKYHPDRSRDNTTALFQAINNAYEILSNQNTRQAYDYFLKNPEANSAEQYYRYYKAVYMPKTNPFLVLFIFFVLISLLQYKMRKSMNQSAVNRILESKQIKDQINQRYWEQGKDIKLKGNKKQITKEDLRKLTDYKSKDEIKEQIESEITISGGLAPPKITDIFLIKLAILPYTIGIFIKDNVRWVYKYWFRRQSYTQEDQNYLTRKILNISKSRWEGVSQKQRSMLLDRKLWIKQNLEHFNQERKKQQESHQQDLMANSAKYKRYMRFMKKQS